MMDLLDNVTIAKPCSASWDAMDGDDRKRFCAGCRLHVYNVAGLDRAEANALLATEDKVCLRIYRREDGTVLTKDCPVGARATAVQRMTAISLTAAAFGIVVLSAMIAGLQQRTGASPQQNALTNLLTSWHDKASGWIAPRQHIMGGVTTGVTTSN